MPMCKAPRCGKTFEAGTGRQADKACCSKRCTNNYYRSRTTPPAKKPTRCCRCKKPGHFAKTCDQPPPTTKRPL